MNSEIKKIHYFRKTGGSSLSLYTSPVMATVSPKPKEIVTFIEHALIQQA